MKNVDKSKEVRQMLVEILLVVNILEQDDRYGHYDYDEVINTLNQTRDTIKQTTCYTACKTEK